VENSYWSGLLGARIARRRALAMAGGTALGSAFLAACGGDQEGTGDKSGLVFEAVETTKQAKRTGTMKDRAFVDPPSLDVVLASNPLNPVNFNVYSTLVRFEPGYLKPIANDVMPDIGESWETSPDGLQITMKIRQGIKWHNKPPVNGRALDMDDLSFMWERFASKYQTRSNVANSANPNAPVLSLTPVDSNTIVIKLKEPIVYALGLFCTTTPAGVILVPKETDSTLDLRSNMLGTGPFMLTNYTPSVGFAFKRNPEFYDKDWALVEQIETPIIAEYAAVLSHLKAGNVYHIAQNGAGPMKAEDVLPTKQDEPRLLIYTSDLASGPSGAVQSLGWLPEGKSPFLDERVRQAASMAIDRDLYLETFFNIAKFETEGLPVETRWNTAVAGSQEGWWLDPRSKDFGPNGKYFVHDPAEAKKLLAAAGYTRGFETISNLPGPELDYARGGQVIDGMLSEVGITSRVNIPDYTKEYIPLYRDGHGQYEGWSYMSTAGGGNGGGSAIGLLSNEYWTKGGAPYHGFSINGKNDQSGDPYLDDLISRGRIERDTEKRRAMVHDLQRYLAKSMFAIPNPGQATGFTLAWPCLGNFRVWRGGRINYRLWIDETKPPFKAA
jgi:peptide/nickel transport system substrate-binding protein